VFQLTFAAITPALIVGAIAERMKFGAVMLFLAIWFTFSYLPIAHMVWFSGGYLFGLGAYDFAGGTVVHINAGVAGLVAAIVLGPRAASSRKPIPPHNLTFTFIGACLLWVGWFGFNAGSNLEANGLPRRRLLNTITAPAAAALAWASPRSSPAAMPRCSARHRVRLPVSSPSPRPPALPVRWVRSSSVRLPASSACGPS
jgi:Amt family ammonium transporter